VPTNAEEGISSHGSLLAWLLLHILNREKEGHAEVEKGAH
jgi:hypothetical protein